MRKVLVTAFEPFGDRTTNASYEAVALLPAQIGPLQVVTRRLPVVFGQAAEEAIKTAREINAAAVLLVGEAAGRDKVTPETTAVNLRRARIPDNRGNQPLDEPIVAGGEETLPSTLPLDAILARCESRSLPVQLSHSAGEYVCNDLFYSVAAALGKEIPVGFVHVPLETTVPSLTSAKVLQVALGEIARALYLADPTHTSSLSFAKSERLTLPEGMAVVSEKDFDPNTYRDYTDERYFRLSRPISGSHPCLPTGYSLAQPPLEEFVAHLRTCYPAAPELQVFASLRCQPSVWVAVREDATDQLVATAIGLIDPKMGELDVDWVEVSPTHRRQGLGRFVVQELLREAEGRATFATVSGEMADPAPLSLYRSCGFGALAVWHVLRRHP